MAIQKKAGAQGKLPKVFDRNPELKKKFEAYLSSLSPEQKEEDLKKFERFVSGEITWSELKGYSKALLKELAKVAYLKYQQGDYPLAESLFKGLSVIDHNNWYYRSALGAIYQKQKLFEQAIEEYSVALFLNEKEMASLTNRGECYLNLKNYQKSLKDFDTAIQLDPEEKNPWGRRARVLKKRIVEAGHGESLKLED